MTILLKHMVPHVPRRRNQSGFTLVELMIIVAVIGILAAIAIPILSQYRMRAFVVETASDLKNFRTAFDTVAMDNGVYPNHSHIILPPGSGVDRYISVSHWLAPTPLGGNYNLEGLNSYPYAGISILGETAPLDIMASLDAKLDDGNLATGRFQLTPNGRHTYMIN